jgi:hypothetical protein
MSLRRLVRVGALVLAIGLIYGGLDLAGAVPPATHNDVTVDNTAGNAVPVQQQGTASVAVQGTATVHVDNVPATQAVTVAVPASAFNAQEDWNGCGCGGTGDALFRDAAGTRYAISSVTLASTGADNTVIRLWVSPDNDVVGCAYGRGELLVTLAAPGHGTASISLPQPILSTATAGRVCLNWGSSGPGGGSVDVVGYKLP